MTWIATIFYDVRAQPKFPEDLMFNKPELDFPVTDKTLVSDFKENLAKAFNIIQLNSDMKIE